MDKPTRTCADCGIDIGHRGHRSNRCEPCQQEHQKKPVRLLPRICLHCKAEYQPRGGLQKWCRDCVSEQSDRYRLNRYGTLELTETQQAIRSGVRRSTCGTCNVPFTYRYIGGPPRKYCDSHVPASLAAGHAKLDVLWKVCVECGQQSRYVNDSGRCNRHEPNAKVNRDCETCGKTFVMEMAKPKRYCSRRCSYTQRGPMDEPRFCEICRDSFYASHACQKYCTGCIASKGDQQRFQRYGISRRALEALKARYDGMCWLCREVQGRCIDHDHASGQVRGWLCQTCNKALHYVERPGWWDTAMAYLRETSRAPAA